MAYHKWLIIFIFTDYALVKEYELRLYDFTNTIEIVLTEDYIEMHRN